VYNIMGYMLLGVLFAESLFIMGYDDNTHDYNINNNIEVISNNNCNDSSINIENMVISFVLLREGNKYVNDENIGEVSRMGITKETYEMFYGKATNDDIKNITIDIAYDIYSKIYWKGNKLDSLSSKGYVKTSAVLMDSGVNLGKYRANKFFQEIIGMDVGSRSGYIDDKTLSHLNTVELTDEEIALKLIHRRKMFYQSLIIKNSNYIVYENGWYNRLDSVEILISSL